MAQPAGCGLDLNAGEHRNGAADHIGRYGDALPADQVSAAFAEAEGNRAAILVLERAGVIAEQARVAIAAGDADLLLDGLLRRWRQGVFLSHYNCAQNPFPIPKQIAVFLACRFGCFRKCEKHTSRSPLYSPFSTQWE